MAVCDDAEVLRDGERRVVTAIVDEQHAVDDIVRNRRVAFRERLLCAIGWHDDSDAVSVQHLNRSVSLKAKRRDHTRRHFVSQTTRQGRCRAAHKPLNAPHAHAVQCCRSVV
jgi:hypothetical protein